MMYVCMGWSLDRRRDSVIKYDVGVWHGFEKGVCSASAISKLLGRRRYIGYEVMFCVLFLVRTTLVVLMIEEN